MAADSVSARDISRLRDVLDLTRPDRPESVAQATLRALEVIRGLVGCDAAMFNDQDSLAWERSHLLYVDDDETLVATREELALGDASPGDLLLRAHWWTGCCSLIERTGRPVVTSVRLWQSEREWARNPGNHEALADEIVMGFPISTFRSLRILLKRETGSAFGERELTLMEMLLPHLQPLMKATYVQAGQTGSAPAPPLLTVRQQEILGLVRLGMPNKRIGRILGISEATVRKHLENVFERLGVQSRTAAVAVAFGEQPATAEARPNDRQPPPNGEGWRPAMSRPH